MTFADWRLSHGTFFLNYLSCWQCFNPVDLEKRNWKWENKSSFQAFENTFSREDSSKSSARFVAANYPTTVTSIRLLCQVSCAACLRWIPSFLPEQPGRKAAAHGPPGPAMQRRSVAPERYLPLPPGWVLMSGRLIADYQTAACWEHTLLAGSNIFMFSCTQTRTPPSPPHRRDPSACWIPDEHQPPPPPEVLLLCLQVVLPGILPAASCFHVAGGIILPFVCACASAAVCVCVCSAPECDAFTGTIFHICFLFWQRPSQPPVKQSEVACSPRGTEQGIKSAAGRRLWGKQSEERHITQTPALWLVVKASEVVCHVCVSWVQACLSTVNHWGFFHVYSTYLHLKVFLCAHAWPCVFAFTPCLVWFVQGEKLKVQTRRAPRCLFWGSITTGISHSSKKAV